MFWKKDLDIGEVGGEFRYSELEHGELHPTMNCDDPEEVIGDIDCVLGKSKKVNVTAAMSNSFGFGGHNSSVIFGPYKE